MTIVIMFHQARYRDFKTFYTQHVCVYWRDAFPGLLSYQRFVEWLPSVLLPLCVCLKRCFGRCTGISCLDSTSLKVCHNRQIYRHKVFQGLAQRGKTAVDCFFGFKLHLVVNDQGELLNIQLTPGNTDDRRSVDDLLASIVGKVFADRGYVSQRLTSRLLRTLGIHFVAKLRRNMKNRLIPLLDKLLSRKREMFLSLSSTNSRTFPRLSILAIAAWLISWSTWSRS